MAAAVRELMACEIREISRRLMRSNEVEYVMGYGMDVGGTVSPLLIDSPDEADRLVWNDRCVHNLATFLKKGFVQEGEGVALVSKGCDVRSIIVLIQEEQVSRDKVRIIGVDCSGQSDEKGELLLKCEHCSDHRPQIYDCLVVNSGLDVIGLDVEGGGYGEVEEVEATSLEERLSFWKREADKCIRCYACREVCPLCYCSECFTDQNLPRYLPPSPSLKGNFLWLLSRAYDLAGRCTGCMECDRACPADIPLHLLNQKMAKDVAELFDYEAGRRSMEEPPLTVFREDDPDEFII